MRVGKAIAGDIELQQVKEGGIGLECVHVSLRAHRACTEERVFSDMRADIKDYHARVEKPKAELFDIGFRETLVEELSTHTVPRYGDPDVSSIGELPRRPAEAPTRPPDKSPPQGFHGAAPYVGTLKKFPCQAKTTAAGQSAILAALYPGGGAVSIGRKDGHIPLFAPNR